MKETGWIKLHRKIQDHWVWQDPNRFQWWIKLIMMVNHTDKKLLIGSNLVECKRGQIITSLGALSTHFGCGKEATRNFIKLLEKDHMIHTETNTRYTRITICNYGDYQDVEHTDTPTGTTPTGQPTTHEPDSRPTGDPTADHTQLKKDKNYKNEKEGEECKEFLDADAQKKNEEDFSDKSPKQPDEKKENFPAKNFGKKEFRETLIERGAEPQHVEDWMKVRESKKAVFTKTAMNKFLNECDNNNFPVADAVKICAERSWQGFQYQWILKNTNNGITINNQSREQRLNSVSDLKNMAEQILAANRPVNS